MPSVSVIIPLYNSEKFIGDTLDSVLSQTYQDFEIIAVDDGSIDNTSSAVRIKNDSRIRYIRQENAGISAARNRGIAEAKGDYIAFIDHDDKWLPDKLETQFSVLKNDIRAGLVFSNAHIIDSSGRRSNNFFNITKPSSGMVFERLLEGNFIPVLTTVVRKDVFDEVGLFDQRYRIAEDWDMFLRISLKYPVIYVNRPLAEYRVHGSSFSKNRELLLTESMDIIDRLVSFAKHDAQRRMKKMRAGYWSILGSLCLKKGDRLKAKRYFSNSIKDSFFNVRPYVGLAGAYLSPGISKKIGAALDIKTMHN